MSAKPMARAMEVVRILNDMARKLETAIIVVTHDEKIILTFKRIYHTTFSTSEKTSKCLDLEQSPLATNPL